MLNPRLQALIEEQQKGHEDTPIFMIGEQLKEIAEREPASAELLEKDLSIEGMGLAGAEGALKKFADENHGKASCFCITPIMAEKILREFYGLPDRNSASSANNTTEPSAERIDFSSFL